QIRKRRLTARDAFHMRDFHLRHVMHEKEGREVIIDAGALQAFAGGEKILPRQRFTSDLLMHRAARRPCTAPVVIAFKRANDVFEIGKSDAIGDEASAPMRRRSLDPWVG